VLIRELVRASQSKVCANPSEPNTEALGPNLTPVTPDPEFSFLVFDAVQNALTVLQRASRCHAKPWSSSFCPVADNPSVPICEYVPTSTSHGGSSPRTACSRLWLMSTGTCSLVQGSSKLANASDVCSCLPLLLKGSPTVFFSVDVCSKSRL
jgi:hypothetical protein